jgi:hypothetical protein
MRIHLSNSPARDDLARFLEAAGFTVHVQGLTMLELGSPHGATPSETAAELHVRVAVWRAMHPGVSARVDVE